MWRGWIWRRTCRGLRPSGRRSSSARTGTAAARSVRTLGCTSCIGLREGHFARWLTLWNAAVDELFTGDRAELAKAHARRVALAFMRRLESFPPAPPGPDGTALTVSRHVPRS